MTTHYTNTKKDKRAIIKEITDLMERADWIETNVPFGTKADNYVSGSVWNHSMYDGTVTIYLRLDGIKPKAKIKKRGTK